MIRETTALYYFVSMLNMFGRGETCALVNSFFSNVFFFRLCDLEAGLHLSVMLEVLKLHQFYTSTLVSFIRNYEFFIRYLKRKVRLKCHFSLFSIVSPSHNSSNTVLLYSFLIIRSCCSHPSHNTILSKYFLIIRSYRTHPYHNMILSYSFLIILSYHNHPFHNTILSYSFIIIWSYFTPVLRLWPSSLMTAL